MTVTALPPTGPFGFRVLRSRAAARMVCALLAGLAPGAPLGAQSIFNSAGIGLPIDALDGRTRALGSFGIGLRGSSLSPTDPGAAGRVVLPTGLIAVQPSWIELSEEGTPDRTFFRGTRFPLVAIAYPVGRGTVTLHAASVFDQRYRGERTVDVVLGGAPVPVRDLFVQEGSLSSLALGYSRMIGRTTSVGIAVGRYTGTLRRALVRDFSSSSASGSIEPYQSSGSWRYSGESVTAGVASDPVGIVRVAASATWSTDLTADATGQTEGGDRSFRVPLQLRLGASSVLTPGLTLSASAVRADWSGTEEDLGTGSYARTVSGVGVGIELSRARLFGREVPIRLGFRHAGLPFSLDDEPASERVFAGGFALILSQANGVVFASTDVAVEKGRRSAGSFAEDFWRATVSLSLSGF